jgi:energy-coupling factor transport system ATP-binding protein
LAQLDCGGVTDLLEELNRLQQEGLAIVVAEHRLDDLISTVDRVLVLDGGRLVADRPARDANLARVLDAAGLVVEASAPPIVTAAPQPGGEQSQAAPVLRMTGLGQRFSGQQQPLWQDVDFRIDIGQRVAIVGENGSGKSTLLRVAAGLVRPTTGHVTGAAAPAGTSPLALVPQNPDLTLFCRTVYEELAFGPRQLGLSAREAHDRVKNAAETLAIAALLDEPPLALSQGQRLRVAVAAALTLRPRLLMLDEPTTGQDPIEVQRLLSAIAETVAAGQTGAVLFSTHDVRIVARFATRALVLAERRLIADCAVAELLADADLLRRAGLRHTSLAATRGAELANPRAAGLDIPRRAGP